MFEDLPPPAAHERLGAHEGALYVDVRTEREYDEGHPPGAWNLPLAHAGFLGLKANREFLPVCEKVLPRDVPLIVGCAVGGRSRQTCELLARAGFTQLVNVTGGWSGQRERLTGRILEAGWVDCGLPGTTEATPGGTWAELQRLAGL